MIEKVVWAFAWGAACVANSFDIMREAIGHLLTTKLGIDRHLSR
jgi:hypothetical protein